MKYKWLKALAIAAAPAIIGAAYMGLQGEDCRAGIVCESETELASSSEAGVQAEGEWHACLPFGEDMGEPSLQAEGQRADRAEQADGVRGAMAAQSGHLMAYFSTYYKESSEGRKHNIALAASKIDGTVLYPEDEFSFNDTVGRRTEANGFRTAYIIQDGEYIEGVGGGVCQVSSTLYNCALLGGLDVTCVRAHSLQVSYVAPSFDSMVSTASDLRFVNTLSGAVTIRMSADGSYLRAELYGMDDIAIRRRSETVETLPFEIEYRDDESLPLGEEKVDSYGKEGLRSEGYLEYFEKGKLVRTVRIRRDTYMPQKRVILRGCGEPKI